jgi:predicted nucleic acid-binding protein
LAATSGARTFTRTMAADPVFLDTNVLVAASVNVHPSHARAVVLLSRLLSERVPLVISSQICREFLVVLTRQPVEGRNFSTQEAIDALDRWRATCTVFDDDLAVLTELIAIVRRYAVKGKQIHDANVIATMRANGVARLATFNAADFHRFEDEVRLEPVAS